MFAEGRRKGGCDEAILQACYGRDGCGKVENANALWAVDTSLSSGIPLPGREAESL
jgi:hypothetical protein